MQGQLKYIIITAVTTISFTLGAAFLIFKNYSNEPVNIPVTANDLSKDKLEETIKGYIMNNPETIIVSVENYQNHKAKEQVDQVKALIKARQQEIANNPDDPKVGTENSKIKVIEFFDYNCSFCKRMLTAKIKLLENNKNVELVFKELPILGESSVIASKAAIAVNIIDKTKYFAFHSALLQHNGAKNEESILELAGKVGINTTILKEKMNDSKIMEILHNNHKIAKEIGLQGTPAYIIGDELFPGALTYDDLIKKIEAISS